MSIDPDPLQHEQQPFRRSAPTEQHSSSMEASACIGDHAIGRYAPVAQANHFATLEAISN